MDWRLEYLERRKKQYIEKIYQNFVYYETCQYYWDHKQQNILEYVLQNQNLWKNKNILVLSDRTGLVMVILFQLGANVFFKETNHLIDKNTSMIQVMRYNNELLDYIFDLNEIFVAPVELKGEMKMLIALSIHSPISSSYERKQISKYQSGRYTLFEIQMKIRSWCELQMDH